MKEGNMTEQIYARYSDYLANGWTDILPLPPKQKFPPPQGFTGARFYDVSPTSDQLFAWASYAADWNICLRMPPTILGIDVDAYGDKRGFESLEKLESYLGELPATWRVSSRDDGKSGIRFYKVPEALAWPNTLGPGIETVHRGHRYAVVWPSIHPITNTSYKWISPSGEACDNAGPRVADLPHLPQKWIHELTANKDLSITQRKRLEGDEKKETEARVRTVGTPCALVNSKLHDIEQILESKNISRHDGVRDGLLSLLRLGFIGHAGVNWSVDHVKNLFIDLVGPDRAGGSREAEREFLSMFYGGLEIVAAGEHENEKCYGSECDGKIRSLDLADFSLPVDLQNAEFEIYADLSWILTGKRPEIEPPEYLLRNDNNALFYKARINGIYGNPETAKSWIAMCAVTEALLQGQKAVYLDIDGNGSAEIASRLLSLGAPSDLLANRNYFRVATTEDTEDLRYFVQDMLQWLPDIAVIDSLGELIPMLGLKSVDNDDITKALRAVVKPLAHEGNACVITIDHLPKSQEGSQTGYAIGGTAKKRAVDGSYLSAEVIQAPAPGKIGKVNLYIEKDRNGALRAVSPGKHAGTFTLDSTDAEVIKWKVELPSLNDDGHIRPTVLMERVSKFLESWNEEKLPNKSDITESVSGKKGAVALAIDILLEEKYIEEIKDGEGKTRARRFRIVRGYRQTLDPNASEFNGGFVSAEVRSLGPSLVPLGPGT
jgi:hypothetical protein